MKNVYAKDKKKGGSIEEAMIHATTISRSERKKTAFIIRLKGEREREREGWVCKERSALLSSFLLCPRCGCSLRYFRLVPALYL